ncbi:MAG: hypothetical protein QM755_13815 [Luteolibacter sp.]
MTDKEILTHLLNLAESLQSHEEIELMQVKALHGRIDNVQNLLGATLKLIRTGDVPGQTHALETLEQLLKDNDIQEGFSKLIARMESEHEHKAHRLGAMRALINKLPDHRG